MDSQECRFKSTRRYFAIMDTQESVNGKNGKRTLSNVYTIDYFSVSPWFFVVPRKLAFFGKGIVSITRQIHEKNPVVTSRIVSSKVTRVDEVTNDRSGIHHENRNLHDESRVNAYICIQTVNELSAECY